MNIKDKLKNYGTTHALALGPMMLSEFNVRIDWDNQNGFWWNETCALVLEVFGLPGNRYESHPDSDYMLFKFKSKKDADLCRILLSERL
jgi:hypothetical protein